MKLGVDLKKIPTGWVQTTFSELFDFQGGSQPPKSEFSSVPKEGYVRLLQIRDFSRDDLAVYIPDLPKWPKCTSNDIMIGRYGASVGKILSGKEGAYNVALVKTIFSEEFLYPLWVKYFLLSDHFQKPLTLLSRSAQNGFNKKELSPMPVMLPPLNEQKRLADKIEALQAKSKKAKKALETAKPLLDKLRQSILASAFRGDLTADWRKKNPDVEPASVLLERIRVERRKKWEENELAKMRANGKEPKDDRWKSKYKEPEPVDTKDLTELPDGWCWTSVDEIACLVQYGSSSKTNENVKDIPVLRMGNIQSGQLVYDNMRYLPKDHKEFPELLLQSGDILFNRTNSAELVGKTAVYEDIGTSCSFASYLIRVRLIMVLPFFVSSYINSPFGRKWIQSCVSQQVGQANVNGTKLKALAIPIPPEKEQTVLVKKIQKVLSISSRMNDQIQNIQEKIFQQDQAILAKAFAGDLVKQVPSDEPAALLLERIKKTSKKRKSSK